MCLPRTGPKALINIMLLTAKSCRWTEITQYAAGGSFCGQSQLQVICNKYLTQTTRYQEPSISEIQGSMSTTGTSVATILEQISDLIVPDLPVLRDVWRLDGQLWSGQLRCEHSNQLSCETVPGVGEISSGSSLLPVNPVPQQRRTLTLIKYQ